MSWEIRLKINKRGGLNKRCCGRKPLILINDTVGKNKRYGGKSIVMSCCGFPVWATLKVDIDSEHCPKSIFDF